MEDEGYVRICQKITISKEKSESCKAMKFLNNLRLNLRVDYQIFHHDNAAAHGTKKKVYLLFDHNKTEST